MVFGLGLRVKPGRREVADGDEVHGRAPAGRGSRGQLAGAASGHERRGRGAAGGEVEQRVARRRQQQHMGEDVDAGLVQAAGEEVVGTEVCKGSGEEADGELQVRVARPGAAGGAGEVQTRELGDGGAWRCAGQRRPAARWTVLEQGEAPAVKNSRARWPAAGREEERRGRRRSGRPGRGATSKGAGQGRERGSCGERELEGNGARRVRPWKEQRRKGIALGRRVAAARERRGRKEKKGRG